MSEENLLAINPTAHLNRAKVRETALEVAKLVRPFHQFERVGGSFLLRIEAATRAAIAQEVKRHPSKGKTLL
jgi:hypothetical protein